MTLEAARDKKIGSQNAIFAGRYLLRNSPKLKKSGSWMTPKSHQKSKIGGHFCNMCIYDPMSPFSAIHVQSQIFSHSRRLKVSDHRKIKCGLFLSLYPHTWIWKTKYFYQSIGSLHGSAIWGELWSGAPQCMHKLLDAIACPQVSTHYTRANQVHYYASFILQIEALPTHWGSCKEQIRS